MGWHELAVHRSDDSLPVDVHHRAVQAVTATVRGALDGTEVDRDAPFTGNAANEIEVACFDANGLAHIVRVQ